MKGIDWGRIAARILAVWLLTSFIGTLTYSLSTLESADFLFGERVSRWPHVVYMAALLAICVLLWTGVFKLVPASATVEADSVPDSSLAARAIVMCAGLWFLVFYGGKAAASMFSSVSRIGGELHWLGFHPTFILFVVVALVGAVLIKFPSVILGRSQK